MKLFLCLVMLLASPLILEAQNFVIRNDKLNIVYTGIDNPVTIVSGNCSCDKLIATVDKGTLVKEKGCNFIYRGDQEGLATVSISQKTATGSKVIGTQSFRVKNSNNFSVSVGFQRGGYYPLQQFKAQAGLTVNTDALELDMTFRIVSFRFIVVGATGWTQSIESEGPYFNAECNAAIAKLRSGDKVIIENIKVERPDHKVVNMNPFFYTIK